MPIHQLAAHLSENVKALRLGRGLTQARAAQLAGVPRATWAHLETGGANPTLQTLHGIAAALQVSIEELIAEPRSAARLYRAGELRERRTPGAAVRKLLPDAIPGMAIDRMHMPAGGRLVGVPHTPGTREYLTCESGALVLTVSGETFTLAPGDVVVFRGDQRHAYHNPGKQAAVGYSVVVLAPTV
jgi:transcriptional regulator with XRE-family HTH domain